MKEGNHILHKPIFKRRSQRFPSYINVEWLSQPMWIVNVTFQQCDSRIQQSEYVSNHWKEKVSGNGYIHAAELDWSKLPQ